jgi:predicted RNA-binding Zn ribbon-like protein
MDGYIISPRQVTPKNYLGGYNANVSESHPAPFELVAGHPALELVNTLDDRFTPNPRDLIPGYRDLLRLTTQLELLTEEQARWLSRTVSEQEARLVLARTAELREALAEIFYARMAGGKPPAAEVAILQRYFREAALHRSLQAAGTHFQWTWEGAERKAEFPLWTLAQAAADLLVSSDAEGVKDCGNPTCRWLFLDLSKNHTRRWCDMKVCGNRMKTRRHQARLRESESS